jgi:hypothetical protein
MSVSKQYLADLPFAAKGLLRRAKRSGKQTVSVRVEMLEALLDYYKPPNRLPKPSGPKWIRDLHFRAARDFLNEFPRAERKAVLDDLIQFAKMDFPTLTEKTIRRYIQSPDSEPGRKRSR